MQDEAPYTDASGENDRIGEQNPAHRARIAGKKARQILITAITPGYQEYECRAQPQANDGIHANPSRGKSSNRTFVKRTSQTIEHVCTTPSSYCHRAKRQQNGTNQVYESSDCESSAQRIARAPASGLPSAIPARSARADLIGYSMGGSVAMQTAIRHPDKVRRALIISSTFGRDGMLAETLEAFPNLTADAFKGSAIEAEYKKLSPTPDDVSSDISRDRKLSELRPARPSVL